MTVSASDPMPYGFKANGHVLEALRQYSLLQQGLQPASSASTRSSLLPCSTSNPKSPGWLSAETTTWAFALPGRGRLISERCAQGDLRVCSCD